ncbi:related to zinc-binding protein [Cephalotrichum gorgonifer]|uniref:Related to zinc-binding protein n=1 Tax=Cephalotrichum gorgonifer TaxID=2041049 RepID=A0AAE8MV01_9PEZI|nr:related to zinc-binding protein [Cephalotrichum gorgonifer]
MSLKCVHKGCGKSFNEGSEEVCIYHPGPPVFHEGQKGWKCCKPRVLTFDEFMTIPPCTEGRHSSTDKPPELEKGNQDTDSEIAAKIESLNAAAPTRKPIAAPQHIPTPPPPQPESEDDDPSLEIPDGAVCKRRGCGAKYKAGSAREGESCVHHPGVPIFHEGNKGYSCCKPRVMEFEQFMNLEGCGKKDRHLFVGSGKDKDNKTGAGGEEILETVRNDFYQTPTTVIASFFLKKIVKDKSTVKFGENKIDLDLVTSDSPPKRYTAEIPLFAAIDPEKTSFKILGTKLEVTLAKADGASWAVLRSDDTHTGEIFQVGRAGSLR